jgi:catechol 2,3-dioxygenase-like lactoylglutathione lyase family enzyme
MASPNATETHASIEEPVPAGFNHLSIPVKDVDQSLRFFIDVLGATWLQQQEGFAEVRCGGMTIGLSKQPGGWTGHDAEFPHYGLLMDAEDMWPMKERIEAHGVPTHPIWTRNGYTGLMYFRDPSGNLFELYCPRVREEDAPKMVRKGENGFMPPLAELNHEWKG